MTQHEELLKLAETIGNHVAAEYDDDPALDGMILRLRDAARRQPEPREVTTVEELDALPVGSVILAVVDGESVVARKPDADVFPFAIDHYWELIGSELGADGEDLVPAIVLYRPEVAP